jgi:phospholipase A1
MSWNNTPNSEPFREELDEADEESLDHTEIKFQLSIKVPVWTNMFGSPLSFWAAYTNISWWQAFNKALSEVFRETNHEPEIFLDYVTKKQFAGLDWRLGRIGFNHQSNGRDGNESRSWNRIIAQAAAERGRFYMSLRAWWRLPERDKQSPDDVEGDDNPDIEDYLGYGDFTGFYQLGKHNISMILRNNLQLDNRGALQLDWSFPFGPRTHLRGVVQYFNGYGESLIDYNVHTHRIGFGVMLTDWL